MEASLVGRAEDSGWIFCLQAKTHTQIEYSKLANCSVFVYLTFILMVIITQCTNTRSHTHNGFLHIDLNNAIS